MVIVNARFLTQPITGVQRYGIELSKEIKIIYKDDVVFVAPCNILHEDIGKELEVKIIGRHTGHLWEQLDLPFFLKKNGDPLLINLSNTAPVFYLNKISTIHDIAFLKFSDSFSKKFVFFYKFLIPCVIKTSRLIITVSDFSKAEILRYYKLDDNKISVVFNAVSNFFAPLKNQKANEKYFLAVSSLNYRKNFISILRAFVLFSKEHKDYKLFVVGDLKTKSFANVDVSDFLKYPQIKFLGRIEDDILVQYYNNAIAFIYPSFYEGFGIPPLEAQACGCPIVVSNISCFPEIFDNSAIYCDPYSIEDIKSRLNEIVNENLRLRYIELGFKNVSRYSWAKSALKLDREINKLIKL